MDRPPTASSRPKTSAGRAPSARSRQPAAPANGNVTSSSRPPSRQTSSRMGVAASPAPVVGSGAPIPPRSSAGSRAGTTMQRVPSSMGERPSTGLARPPSASMRPITQQGVSGIRAPTRMGTASTRQVFDKSYFIGVLRAKISQLNVEIGRLAEQKQHGEQDRAELAAYEARAQASALEIRDMQGKLIDLNVITDRMHMNADMADIELEAARMKEKANELEADLQELLRERQAKEQEVESLQAEIEEQKKLNDAVTAAMDPNIKARYDELKQESEQLKQRVAGLEADVEELEDQKARLEMEVDGSPMKKKAVHLQETLTTLKDREAELTKEKESQETPEQKKEKLIEQMRQINHDIATIEKQYQHVKEQINMASEELHEYDAHGGESQQMKNHAKYLELMVKDHQIDEMLRNYPKQHPLLQQELEEYSDAILTNLRKISANIKKANLSANITDMDEEGLRSKLRGNASVADLKDAHVRLQEELITLNELEESTKAELHRLEERTHKTADEIEHLMAEEEEMGDADGEVEKMERVRIALLAEVPDGENQLRELQNNLERNRRELHQLPNYEKVQSLQKKLRMLEETNAEKRAELDAMNSETDYGPIRDEVLRMQVEYNEHLIAISSKIN